MNLNLLFALIHWIGTFTLGIYSAFVLWTEPSLAYRLIFLWAGVSIGWALSRVFRLTQKKGGDVVRNMSLDDLNADMQEIQGILDRALQIRQCQRIDDRAALDRAQLEFLHMKAGEQLQRRLEDILKED